MKLSSLKSLIVGLLILLTATTAYADYEAQRPNRRRSQKQYTSPEEIKAERDSIARDTLVITEIVSASTTAPEPRRNTPEQIDSVIAMWRATATVEAYERYFNDFLAVSEHIDTTLLNDSIDSIYVARLDGCAHLVVVLQWHG